MAQAYLISPQDQTIAPIEVADKAAIAAAIGYSTLETDAVDNDRLFFDEECFIRATPGRFQIDSLIPVAGKGVVVGVADDGETLTDVQIDLETLRSRTAFK